jgi:hypothetical protein
MVKSIRDSMKKPRLTAKGLPRKRPPKAGKPVVVRLQDDQLHRLDEWIKALPKEHLSRPEAVRRVLQLHFDEAKRK